MRKLVATSLILILFALYLPISVHATSQTISSFQTSNGWPYGGTTCTLRIYADRTFTSSDGLLVIGGAVGSNSFVKEVTCTIDPVTHIVTIPSITNLPSTIDSSDTNATYTGQLWDSKRIKRDVIFSNFRIPSTPNPITWQQLNTYNHTSVPVRDTETYTKLQINNLLNNLNPAPKMSDTQTGIAQSRTVPVDVLDPTVIEYGDPWVTRGMEVYNVNRYPYNALADASDQTLNIQTALTAGAGKVVYFPYAGTGTYVFAAVTVPTGTTIIADPGVALKLKATSASTVTPLFDVRGPNVTFYRLKLDGNRSNQSGVAQADAFDSGTGGRSWRALIKADGNAYSISNLKVIECEISNSKGAGVATEDVSDVYIVGNRTTDTNYEGFFLWQHAAATDFQTNAVVTGNRVYNVGYGGTGVATSGGTGNAIVLTGYKGAVVSNNLVDYIDRDGIKLESGEDITVTGNTLRRTGMVNALYPVNYSGFHMTSNFTYADYVLKNIKFAGNTISDTGLGVLLQVDPGNVYNITIENNTIDNTRAALTPDAFQVAFSNAANLGVNIRFNNNWVTNVGRYGVYFQGGNGVEIKDNHFVGDFVTVGTRAMQIDPIVAMNGVQIEGNRIIGFTNAGGPGIVTFGDLANSLTYTNLILTNNTIITGSASLFAWRADITTLAGASTEYIVSGFVDGNYTDGKITSYNSALKWGMNQVVGALVNGVSGTLTHTAKMPISLESTGSVDYGATAAGTCDIQTVAVKGARAGDIVAFGLPVALATSDSYQVFWAYVSTDDVVSLKRCNPTNATTALSNPAAATVTFMVNGYR